MLRDSSQQGYRMSTKWLGIYAVENNDYNNAIELLERCLDMEEDELGEVFEYLGAAYTFFESA